MAGLKLARASAGNLRRSAFERRYLPRPQTRSVGPHSGPTATLTLNLGSSARRAEPNGRVSDFEVMYPEKAQQATN